jgi:hypothetical protein
MYARVTTLGASPDRVDDATRHVRDQVLPQLQQQEGFKWLITLGDRQSGKVLGIALWESEEALRATEETAARLRGGTPEATGAAVAGAENYEVAIFEVSS